jgi:cell division protein FtsA
MEEIIEQVYYEIKSSGLEKKLIAGIVVTGGGAQLKNITQLFEYMTGMDTRIGYPTEHLGKAAEDVTSPMYATGVGLLIKGFQSAERKSVQSKEPEEKAPAPRQGWLDKWLSKGNEWLAGEEN